MTVNGRKWVVSSRTAFIVRMRLADGRLSGAGTRQQAGRFAIGVFC